MAPDPAPERRAFLISGNVQGVGFRWWTRKNAEGLGLRGTVRNRPDGRVELHLEGPPESVAELRARLKEGPRPATVRGIQEIPAADELPDGFQILY